MHHESEQKGESGGVAGRMRYVKLSKSCFTVKDTNAVLETNPACISEAQFPNAPRLISPGNDVVPPHLSVSTGSLFAWLGVAFDSEGNTCSHSVLYIEVESIRRRYRSGNVGLLPHHVGNLTFGMLIAKAMTVDITCVPQSKPTANK